MDVAADQKQISGEERTQINKQVKIDLVEHLYQGCLPGTISGVAASIALFLDFYGYTPTYLLIGWVIAFNFMMLSLSALYYVYTKYKDAFNITTWEASYSVIMTGCALSWVPCIYLMPHDPVREYLALIALFLATNGYATGTIGQFKLCTLTLNIILLPLIAWSFYKGGLFYNIIGSYSLIYMCFLLGANHRSTSWLKESLKLKLENTLVSYQANHDLLTNLPNQRLLPQYIETEINVATSAQQFFALVSFSLNRMEMINDSLGYQAGDTIMQAVAGRFNTLITQLTRTTDEQSRYILTLSRKDIFNIIITPIQLHQIERKIQTFFSILENAFFYESKEIKVTASIGVSIFNRDGKDAQTLQANADAAMLLAKQFGGNCLEFYRPEINSQLPKKLELENDLHAALKRNEFQLYYQPLIDLKTNQICGMEALLRWSHHLYGLISPMQFIPVAEETALIVPIGEWVLKEACIQTLKWHKMGFSSLKVAVNLSAKQMVQDDIISMVQRILKETNFNPRYLELEITETSILNEEVIPILKKFTDLGISLAVDDFGTGYSGLSYLKRFAVDKLKIDQSFVRDLPMNNHSVTIVSAIVAMARELKIRTLAEGVETKEQLQFLISKGCDFVQGYYFSKPLEASYFTQYLLSFSKKTEDTL